MLDEFLQTCTVRQVRTLREIALGLEVAKLQVQKFSEACLGSRPGVLTITFPLRY
jgi:hypothetical protein